MSHSNYVLTSNRFEAGADVCSTEQRVGPLSPPQLENGWTDFDAIWRLTYPDGGHVSLPRNRVSIDRRLTAMHERYRQTTNRQGCDNTGIHWLTTLTSHESAKM